MDKKTFVQFLIISLVIMSLWYLLMGRYYRRRQQLTEPGQDIAEPGQGTEQVAEPGTGETPEPPEHPPDAGVQEATTPPEVPPESMAELERGITLSNEVISTSWTNEGAALESVRLLKYKAPYYVGTDGDKVRPVLELVKDFQEGYRSDVIETVSFFRGPGHQEGGWSREVAVAGLVYDVVDRSDSYIVFEGVLDEWLKVRKTVSILDPGAYAFNVELEFENLAQDDIEFSYRVRGAAGIERETLQTRALGAAVGWGEGGKAKFSQRLAGKIVAIERKAQQAEKVGDLQKQREALQKLVNESKNLRWAGTVNQYFVALTQPIKPGEITLVEYRSVTETDMLEARGRWAPGSMAPKQERIREQFARANGCAVIRYKRVSLGPGQGTVRAYRFVAAPKLDAVLKRHGTGMTKAIKFGLFPSISRLLLAMLKFFYSVIPNYGIAIILLTIVVKVALHPLTRKGQVGMQKMQRLGPKLAELKKKFGDDRQKFAQEQMALFKRYGVHPMSGCLPLLLQMPVFFSLFGTLRGAVELRQAMFIPGWISDLSRPDTIFHLPFHLPVFGNEVNLLPFLMLGAWVLNSKFTPKSPDPQAQQQQRMMKWMPVIFTVMLYHMASGLLLYWTMSSTLGVLEQWLIRRSLAGVELKPVGEDQGRAKKNRKPGPAPQRSGLFGKLMRAVEHQKRQSERARSGKPDKRV